MNSTGDEPDGNNSAYFKSYMDATVHELMLKDQPRTLAYKKAIEENAHLFQGKIVLDVGAGTGILSLFAAKAGAQHVYAVEASNMADFCRQIVQANGFSDTITVIHSMIEEAELPVKTVDVIVSEWMGFYLLHESMLDSVLFARDKWLAEDGFLFPSHARILVAPINMDDYCREKFAFWEDVYGFDFSALIPSAMHQTLRQPVIRQIKAEQCLASAQVLADFNLKETKLSDVQSLDGKFAFTLAKEGMLHGLAAWFEVDFNSKPTSELWENGDRSEDKSSITLSTSPFCEETHWKQTVCFLPSTMCIQKGETIYCKVELSQDEGNKRLYNISLQMLESLEDTDEDISDDSDDYEEEEDVSSHPTPCDCGAGRCRLIKALVEKYDAEQSQLEMEAEFDDVTAEVQAAEALDAEANITTDSSYLEESSYQE